MALLKVEHGMAAAVGTLGAIMALEPCLAVAVAAAAVMRLLAARQTLVGMAAVPELPLLLARSRAAAVAAAHPHPVLAGQGA